MKKTLQIGIMTVGLFYALGAVACSKEAPVADHAETAEGHAAMGAGEHGHSASGHGHEHGEHHEGDDGEHHEGAKDVKNGFDEMPPVGTKAVCPVMKNEFTVTKDTLHSVYKGKTYVFCCPACKPQFEENPEKYL